MEISDKAVRASENNAGAFVNLLTAEMEGLIRSSAFNFGRMLFGDGSGVLCTVSSASGTTVTVDSVKNVIEGMTVDILTSGGGAVSGATGRRILSVDRDANTITLSGGALSGVAESNIVCVQGSYNLELTGLGAIFQDTARCTASTAPRTSGWSRICRRAWASFRRSRSRRRSTSWKRRRAAASI